MADDARKVARYALNVAQDNYKEVQQMVQPLVDNSTCLQQCRIVHVANAVLNSVELGDSVAALTVSVRSLRHQEA
ncbi:hypothetical protein Hanom_Chr02g00130921 [Helianthus anomalus]